MTKRKRAPGAGRKPMAPGEAMTATIKVPVRPDQHAAVVAAAESESQSIADWGRAAFELALARGSTR